MRSWTRPSRASPRSRRIPTRTSTRTRTCTRRSSASATSGGRSAGRSRNDQVAAAFRMYVLDACAEAREAIDALALVVLSFAESEAETVMPGYTHLQRAARDARPPPARMGGDARPRPHALRRRRGGGVGEPARRRGARGLDPRASSPHASCGTRSTPSPIATSHSTTCTRRPCSSRTSRGSARRSCSGRPRSSGSCDCPSRPRRVRR